MARCNQRGFVLPPVQSPGLSMPDHIAYNALMMISLRHCRSKNRNEALFDHAL